MKLRSYQFVVITAARLTGFARTGRRMARPVTGFLNQLNGVFVERANKARVHQLYERYTGEARTSLT